MKKNAPASKRRFLLRRASLLCVGLTLFAAIMLLGVTGCTPAPNGVAQNDVGGKIVVTGSSTAAPLVADIGKLFEQSRTGVRVDVQTGGSSRGIADVASGLADIGLSSRDLKPSEMDGKITHVVASDGVAFVVHQDNPVEELTDNQLRDIFTGRTTDWSDVGGRKGVVTVVSRADGRSELDLITEFLGISTKQLQAGLIAGETQHALKTVASDPGAISFISLGASLFEAKRGAPIKLLRLRGVEANAQTVQSGAYPLGRPLLLITSETPTALVREFVDFALSEKVAHLAERHAFVSPQ